MAAFGKTLGADRMNPSRAMGGMLWETIAAKPLLPLSIAFRAIAIAEVAIANRGAAVHKDRAFQASSPKNFTAGRKTGLFFGRDFPYGTLVSSANTRTES